MVHALFDERRYLIPFRSGLLPQIFCDVLVLGGGVAGMRAAIEAADAGADVIVLSKSELTSTNTSWAQGGIAGVMDAPTGSEPGGDSVEAHVRDTLDAGAGLCDERAVRFVCAGARERLAELIDWGMPFDRDLAGELRQGREGGHSAARILHAGGDATGAALQRTLTDRVFGAERVRLFEKCFAIDLITPDGATPGAGPVLGAITYHKRYGLQMIWARSTVLASGGAGQVYRESTNPRAATGDGLAMAYRAGATLADMAFVQFHPTVLYVPGAARSLISEAVRGEGAVLRDEAGRAFMAGEHELADLAPRDVVSRSIVRKIAAQGGGRVWLDCRMIEGFADRFPSIARTLARFDLDPQADLIPVHPAAHYTIGGVRTDLEGATGVEGLFAVGEASCTGLHGANRLASNSLLEGLVMGREAGLAALRHAGNGGPVSPVSIVSDIRPSEHAELDLVDVRSSLRSAMWKHVGVERTGGKLADAGDMLSFWARYTLDKIFDGVEGWEVQNMLQVGAQIVRSALAREESRGTHARADFPDTAGPASHAMVRLGVPGVVSEPGLHPEPTA